MSYSKIYLHIVFRTHRSIPSIPEESKRVMLKYIYELCRAKNWHLIRINGYLDHLHMLISMAPSQCVADIVREVKSFTSSTFQRHPLFPNFDGWNKGYGVFSIGHERVEIVRNYIMNQEQHHSGVTTGTELKQMLRENNIEESQYEEW